jgi:hypothetical protein
MSVNAVLSYARDIRPLFRDRDINSMRTFGGFDLSVYEDVCGRAADILRHLEAGDMPCDGPWPAERIALFRQWIADGTPP